MLLYELREIENKTNKKFDEKAWENYAQKA